MVRIGRNLGMAWLAAGTVLAGGCSTTATAPDQASRPGRTASGSAAIPAPSAAEGLPAAASTAPPPATASRGGGYYLDDGPGGLPPARIMELAARPDPVPVSEPLHPRANRPYRVLGNDYRPMTRRSAFVEEGIASWYGRRFHGQPTSIGERYDMYAMTAAHPTLPIPSYARVTSLENGRSVIVRVNDRGPFLHGRVIDLSYLAAFKLGYVDAGSAPVRVELLDPDAGAIRQVRSDGGGQVVRTGLRQPARAATAPAAASAVAAAGVPAATPAATATDTPATAADTPGTAVPAATPVAAPVAAAATARTAAPDTPAGATPVAPAVAPAPDATIEGAPVQNASGAASTATAAASTATDAGHFLQLGAFRAEENAQAALARFGRQLAALQVPLRMTQEAGLFRVQAGPYGGRDEARRAGEQVRALTGLAPLLLER